MNKKLARLIEPGMRLYFAIMVIFVGVTAWQGSYWLAGAEGVVTLATYIYFVVRRRKNRREILGYIQSSTENMDTASKETILNMPTPMAIIHLSNGEIVWANERFEKMTGKQEHFFEVKISDAVPKFSTEWLLNGKNQGPEPLWVGDRRYSVYGNLAHPDDKDRPVLLATLYFVDETELLDIKDEYFKSRPVVAIILLDNYDELTKNLTDKQKSALMANIDDQISAWADGKNGILRKTDDRDRYVFIFEERYYKDIVDDRFSLLEKVREFKNSTGVSATVSIGVGRDGASFSENYAFASLGIEMCLARGGDQAVVKDRFNFTFYGGRNLESERHTKVKSRVMANSLAELVSQSSSVFVMGHKVADIDAVGAAAGILCLCRKKDVPGYIVIDENNNSSGALLALLKARPEYAEKFITPQDALLDADSRSLLVVVDTNRPDQVESLELLQSCNRVAVVDHHRRAADYIENHVFNFHEPFASSASELVTELLQYQLDVQDILPVEALALLAGISLDTKSFTVRTSGRTFDAAAFLRRAGADPVEVKKIFKNNIEDTMARYSIIQKAKQYRKEIAIAALDYTVDRTIAAQAADELLNISGITTSFVLYPDEGRIIISARSIGDTNVQMVLESLGGGGNAATAGAQVPDKTLTEVLSDLVASIDKYYEQ